MVHAGPKLISHSPLPFDSSSLQFEVVEGGDLLRYALSAAVDACADSWRFSKSWLGLIPRNSIIGKLPYYRCAQGSEACVQGARCCHMARVR
jgi:hypothetical protein